jgi:GNAT superfamily N-acetyltransferase
MRDLTIKRFGLDEMDDASTIHRTAFDDRMPWLAGLHTPAEDRRYFRQQVFQKCEVWGALDNTRLIGIIAFREDWIDHLYVLLSAQGHGVGTAL